MAQPHVAESAAAREAYVDADMDQDGFLQLQEYTWFRHPEFSRPVRERFALDFIRRHDHNHDGMVNASEFLFGGMVIKAEGNNPNSAQAYDYRAELQARTREFHDDLDVVRRTEEEEEEEEEERGKKKRGKKKKKKKKKKKEGRRRENVCV